MKNILLVGCFVRGHLLLREKELLPAPPRKVRAEARGNNSRGFKINPLVSDCSGQRQQVSLLLMLRWPCQTAQDTGIIPCCCPKAGVSSGLSGLWGLRGVMGIAGVSQIVHVSLWPLCFVL